MIADDLFAGAGGWDLAAAQLDIHARGVENMKEARATRDAAGLTTIHDDVWTFQPDGKAAGLIASPPCQTFSQAGKGTGRKALDDVLRLIDKDVPLYRSLLRSLAADLGDDRTALVLAPLHYALRGDYDWLAWEQVPTVLPVWESCANRLRADGWNVWTGLLQAETFGVAQTRKRAFLLASRSQEVGPPPPTHSRYYARIPDQTDLGVEKWVSMADGLGWGLTQRPAYTITGGSSHAASGIEWGGKSVREGMIEAASGGLPDWCHKRPATTVVGSFCPDVIAAPGYRTTVSRQNALDSVRVTVSEAGILQSFPADYPWQGSRGKQFLQAGNAIPPGMALHALAAAAGVARSEAAA